MTSPLPVPGLMQPHVYVDWQRDGDFVGPYDEVTHDVAADPGFEIDGGRDGIRSLAPPKVQAGSFELLNHTGKYSQHRADSPVYQRVVPGRMVSYTGKLGVAGPYNAHDPYNATDYYNGSGIWQLGVHLVNEISQDIAWGSRRVKISTIGQEVVLTAGIVNVPIMTGVRTDQCVTALLDACGWPSSARAISLGDTTLSYWWADARRPWDALIELVRAEGGGATFYVDRNGIFHYENRNYRTITPRSQTSQAKFLDHRGTGSLYFVDLSYDPGYDVIINRATYATKRRAAGALAPVWSYGATLTLTAGESRTLIVRPSDPFLNPVAPVVGTDYSVSSGSASVTLASSSGVTASIVVTAGGSGASIVGVTSNGIQLRAQPLTVISETTAQNSVDASVSIAKFSPIPGQAIPIPFDVGGWPELDPAMAAAVCDSWVSRYMDGRPAVTITLRNVDLAHADQIVRRTVSDRITLVETNTGLNVDAWVNMQRLEMSGPMASVVQLVLACELCDTLKGSVWDASAALWGSSSSDPLGAVWGT
jgi:hypothetical protein